MESKKQLKQTNGNRSHMIWKIVAIVSILIFAVVIIGGIMKLSHFKDSMKPATESEISTAKSIVLNEIQSRGENASNYMVRVSEGIRVVEFNHTKRRVIEVSLKNNSTDNANRHMFLLDADSWQVLMHSEVQFYGWMYDDYGRFDDNRRFGASPPPPPSNHDRPRDR